MAETTNTKMTVGQLDAIFAASPYYRDLEDDDPENFDGDDDGILYPLRDGSAVRVDWCGSLVHIPAADGPALAPEGPARQSIRDRIDSMTDATYAAYLERSPVG